jgi:hypothetical protein
MIQADVLLTNLQQRNFCALYMRLHNILMHSFKKPKAAYKPHQENLYFTQKEIKKKKKENLYLPRAFLWNYETAER